MTFLSSDELEVCRLLLFLAILVFSKRILVAYIELTRVVRKRILVVYIGRI
jgi:hypothetical protein